MLFTTTSDYFNPAFNFVNNISKTEPNQIFEATQKDIPNIFSPLNNNINILELSSLNNYNNSNYNPSYNVKVKKLPSFTSKDIITTNSGKKTLVLDLDETLVHSSTQKPFPNKKNIILHLNIKNIYYTIYVILRPFLESFLYELSLCYDLYIFTASMSQYAETLLKIIDKNKVIIQVLNRDHCQYIKGLFIKDLSIFKKDFKDIIIIDNNPVSYSLNKNNGIPIPTWIDDPNDKELLKLIPIMKLLSTVKDVRPFINKIVNKKRAKIDFSKVNSLLKFNYKMKNNLTQSMNATNEEIKDSKNFIKRSFSLNVNINNNALSFNNNNTDIDKPVANNPLNQNIIKKNKTINNDIIQKTKNKLNLIKAIKINSIEDIPLKNIQNKKKPIKKIKISSDKKNTNIYNISIENINNIQNKINILNNSGNSGIQEYDKKIIKSNFDFPRNRVINKRKPNNNAPLSKPSIHHPTNSKKLRNDLYKSIKNQININKIGNVVNNEKENVPLKTEGNDKYPTDSVKDNLPNYFSLNNEGFFNQRRFQTTTSNSNAVSANHFTKNSNNSFKTRKMALLNLKHKKKNDFNDEDFLLDYKMNETLQPEKNNGRLVVMKILSKPKKLKSDSSKNSLINQPIIKVTKIIRKNNPMLERQTLDKFPSEKITFNHGRIFRFEKM